MEAVLRSDQSDMESNDSATRLVFSSLLTFIKVMRDVVSSGVKLIQDVDGALHNLGLNPLAEQVKNIMQAISQQMKKIDVTPSLQNLQSDKTDTAVVRALALFVDMQMLLAQNAAENLTALLNTEVCGHRLQSYVNSDLSPTHNTPVGHPANSPRKPAPPAKPCHVKSHATGMQSSVSHNTVSGTISVGSEHTNAVSSGPCDDHSPPRHTDESSHLVSDAEIKDVIDLLSGVTRMPVACQSSSQAPPTHAVLHMSPPLSQPIRTAPPRVSTLPPQTVLTTRPALADMAGFYHRPLGAQVSDSALPVKTNTWPMRPSQQQVLSMEEISAPSQAQVYDGFCSDLEFSQYVNSVQQRTRRGQAFMPWIQGGDPVSGWSPLMYHNRESRQWSTAEDSSNCSDESSSNGDWIHPKRSDNDTHAQETKSTTATWPPKHPWATQQTASHNMAPPSTASYTQCNTTAWTGY